jgi:competence protein ComEA
MKQVGLVLAGMLVGFLIAGILLVATRIPAGTPVALNPPPTKIPIEIHVVGAVLRPGVYLFPEGSRVQDAITTAGGLTSDAEIGGMNLAAKLEDGQQLEIPASAGSAPSVAPTTAFRIIPSSATATPSGDLININSASLDQLESLPGIGPTTAQNIIDYRTEHGPFAHIEDILNVAGIGPATFDSIKDLITV